ncbi:hypothetical protein [Deinococcus sp. QL22]|uniref:hypothetical protein n=1 Tax=Deinococcus sp. QL22 TaxID=2939437 RepID=UPI002017C8A3|nr:hypothetical protein [Deinococcus sp. QL22]UQN04857.1 hypothetical protein M1R55_07945 [Deinococcus sp. QL22]
MKNLQTPTGLFAGGKWLPPGSPVPGDLPGFDYEKHARKGMLEDTQGAEIVNPAHQFLSPCSRRWKPLGLNRNSRPPETR